MNNFAQVEQARSPRNTTVAGVLTIVLFAGLSIASGNSKTDASGSKESTSAAATAAGGDIKNATLVGSCDRSGEFNKDCTEFFAPLSTTADAKSSCSTLGGKFRLGPCPRIDAISQCFEGYAPALSGSYAYEGAKSKVAPGDCPRGYKDLKKDPELKPSSSPASCNAVATAGTCTIYSSVTAETERACLDSGAKLQQPPETCPPTNGLAALKLQTKEGTTDTEYFYATPYKNADGTHTWKLEDVLLICGLAGSSCQKIPFEPAPAAEASAAPAAKGKTAPAKAPAPTAKGAKK